MHLLTHHSTLRHLLVYQRCCGSGFSSLDPHRYSASKSGFRSLVNSVLIFIHAVCTVGGLTSVGDPGHFDADPDLCLMDPDPTPDSTPFFSDFQDAKKLIFFHTYPQAHYIQS